MEKKSPLNFSYRIHANHTRWKNYLNRNETWEWEWEWEKKGFVEEMKLEKIPIITIVVEAWEDVNMKHSQKFTF